MNLLISPALNELITLFNQIPEIKQNELLNHIRNLLKGEKEKEEKIDMEAANKHLASLAGSIKTNIKLTDEELEEAIRSSYYKRNEL